MISAEPDVRRRCFSSWTASSATAPKACCLAHMAHSANTEAASQAVAPAKNADWVHAYYARLRSLYNAQDSPSLKASQILNGKERDNMIKSKHMSTLFVGIDVSSKSNVVCEIDFDEK